MKISVFGSGSWGTALAQTLAVNGHNVLMYSRTESTVDSINQNNLNDRYLISSKLNPNIKATNDIEVVASYSDYWLLVTPSHTIQEVCSLLKPFVNEETKIIHATKGFNSKTLNTISQEIKETLNGVLHNSVSVISGPSHAEEVVNGSPTTIVVASEDKGIAKEFQRIFANKMFRVYTSEDVLGVELGGALKNIFGLAAGISDGLGYGDNAKAAIISRGIEEMVRLAVAMGAKEKTVRGLTGMGDLIVTATSKHSRNWKTGNAIGKGKTLDETLKNLGMVAEGVKALQAAKTLGEKFNLELPIIYGLNKIIYENYQPQEVVQQLMDRLYKDEF